MIQTQREPWTSVTPREKARRLLMAANTAIALLESMHALFWDLYADEILALTQHERQDVIEQLAMALVDEAWPPDQHQELEDFIEEEHRAYVNAAQDSKPTASLNSESK